MSEPHNHHFVPQFLLRKFLDEEGRLWVYDTEARTIEPKSTKGAGSIRDLYAIKMSDGTTDFSTLEKGFSTEFESPAAPSIKKLLNRQFLSEKEAFSFVRFVAAQMCRTPAFFDRINQTIAPVHREMYKRVLNNANFRDDVIPKLLAAGAPREHIDEILESVEVEPNKQFVMFSALKQLETTAFYLSQMKWCFLKIAEGDPDLIIGDHPVTLFDNDPDSRGSRALGIANPHIEIAMPMSTGMAAFGRWDGPVSYGELLPGSANALNLRTLYHARQFVYASRNSTELLADALKEKGTGPKVHLNRVQFGDRVVLIREYY